MKTNIITVCDFAKDYNGQLNIIGTFSHIRSAKFPTEPLNFTLVCQFMLEGDFLGDHNVTISIRNKETGEFLTEKQELRLNVGKQGDAEINERLYPNLLFNFNNVVFISPATYVVEVKMDDNLETLEFYVVKV